MKVTLLALVLALAGCGADELVPPADAAPVCGNGILEAGEQCDDGNTDDGDGCGAACVDPECGDAIVQPEAGEVCDDGNTDAADGCSATCDSDETCGNSVLDAAVGETCDDGNTDGGDGCSATCVTE